MEFIILIVLIGSFLLIPINAEYKRKETILEKLLERDKRNKEQLEDLYEKDKYRSLAYTIGFCFILFLLFYFKVL